MILAAVLERSAGTPNGCRFTIKGGVALELRLRTRARATKDIDLVLHDVDAELAWALERAVADQECQGFIFRRKGEPLHLDNGTASVQLAVTYHGDAWASIAVDLARAEPGEADVDLVPAIALEDAFGIIGPADLPVISLRMHIAQKLHGMTLPPRPGRRNGRFRDLVDLLLLEDMVTDYYALRGACESVFAKRGTHDWPPPLDVPAHWVDPFARMARDLELPVTDAESAMVRVRSFVERICAAE